MGIFADMESQESAEGTERDLPSLAETRLSQVDKIAVLSWCYVRIGPSTRRHRCGIHASQSDGSYHYDR